MIVEERHVQLGFQLLTNMKRVRKQEQILEHPYSSNQKWAVFHESMLEKSEENENRDGKSMDLDFRTTSAVQGDLTPGSTELRNK